MVGASNFNRSDGPWTVHDAYIPLPEQVAPQSRCRSSQLTQLYSAASILHSTPFNSRRACPGWVSRPDNKLKLLREGGLQLSIRGLLRAGPVIALGGVSGALPRPWCLRPTSDTGRSRGRECPSMRGPKQPIRSIFTRIFNTFFLPTDAVGAVN